MNNKYIIEIWALQQKNSHARSGMGGYGVAFDLQREYYQKLSEDEKRSYEQAVLELCQSDEIKKANLALAICSQLKDVFPDEWAMRVADLIEKLIENGLQPAYTNTTTYAILDLIWSLKIRSLLPFANKFSEQITRSLKEGNLPKIEWLQLYGQVSRILIALAPDDFWREFQLFYQDRELINKLGEKVTSITIIWSSFGTSLYGPYWLEQLTKEYSKFTDELLKARVLGVIDKEKSASVPMKNCRPDK